MLFLSLHLKLYPPSEKSINYFTRGRQAPETPKTEGNIIPPPAFNNNGMHRRVCTYTKSHMTCTYICIPRKCIHLHIYACTSTDNTCICRITYYSYWRDKLQDKNFLEKELNVLHGSKISIDGILATSMWAEHHDRELRERCGLSYSRQEAEREKGAILI